MMLRTVSAGPTMVAEGRVGFRTDAPITPVIPSTSMMSETTLVASAMRWKPVNQTQRRPRGPQETDPLGADLPGQLREHVSSRGVIHAKNPYDIVGSICPVLPSGSPGPWSVVVSCYW